MSAHNLSYGNGLPSDYFGNIMPRDTFVIPVVEPLYEQVGQPGGEINTENLFVSSMAISSIQGEFLSNNVDMSKVNLTVSSIAGTSNATLSTIGNVLDSIALTSLLAFKSQLFNIAGTELQGQVFFGVSTLATQFSNTVYSQTLSWTPSKFDPIVGGNATCIVTPLSDQAEVSTPLTAIQSLAQPYNSFTVYGQSNAKFAYLITHVDQTVI